MIAAAENLSLEQTIAVGDGANDLPMLSIAGLLWIVFGVESTNEYKVFYLLFLPVVANSFWLFQVMGWTFILGMIGRSLMFLAGYGGMVSLLQMSIAGMAGYMVAILGSSGASVSLGLSWRKS